MCGNWVVAAGKLEAFCLVGVEIKIFRSVLVFVQYSLDPAADNYSVILCLV